MDPVKPEVHDARSTDDVGDRVECSHLMEVDLVDRGAVHPSFGLGEALENRRGDGAHPGVELSEKLEDVGEMPHDGGVGHLDMDPGGVEARSLDLLGIQRDAEVECPDRRRRHLERHTCADEGAEQHVAARSRPTVEPPDHHERERSVPSNDSIRTAAHAAPKPLSMLTTATPCAQLARALLSAVEPPSATP